MGVKAREKVKRSGVMSTAGSPTRLHGPADAGGFVRRCPRQQVTVPQNGVIRWCDKIYFKCNIPPPIYPQV
jgi:hypothetical protein